MKGIIIGGNEDRERIKIDIEAPLFKKYFNKNNYIVLKKDGTLELKKKAIKRKDVLTSNKVIPKMHEKTKYYILSINKKKLNNNNYLLLDLEERKWFAFENKKEVVKKLALDYLLNNLKEEGVEIDENFDKYLENELQDIKTINYANACSLLYYIFKNYYKYNTERRKFARKFNVKISAINSLFEQKFIKHVDRFAVAVCNFLDQIMIKEMEELVKEIYEYCMKNQERLKQERLKQEEKCEE